MPLHVAKVRSDSTGPEGAADESTQAQEVGPGGTDCAAELLTQEETSLILRRSRAAKVTP